MRRENEYDVDIGMSGTSGTLVIVKDNAVCYANVGDSLACLSRQLSQGSLDNYTNDSMILTKPFH